VDQFRSWGPNTSKISLKRSWVHHLKHVNSELAAMTLSVIEFIGVGGLHS
jgi:hypothetical protein